jgi:gamma-glutamylcyclotransferase (GGCT)/AIG2-like uncharacterized protein YtfP
MSRKPKIPTRKDYKKELWRVFSLFIRQRDADEDGISYCISCGKPGHWRGMDAGHFYSQGGYPGIVFHEKNVNGQCKRCNLYKEGNKQGYTKGLVTKYGEGVLEELDMLKHRTQRLSLADIKLLIAYYKGELRKHGWYEQ